MEIHSSSLAFIPNSYQPKESKKQEIESQQHQIPQSLPLENAIEKPFDAKSFQQLTTVIEESQHISAPTNARTARALNAYTLESIQPTQTQRSELISNIDLFA